MKVLCMEWIVTVGCSVDKAVGGKEETICIQRLEDYSTVLKIPQSTGTTWASQEV